MGAAVGGPGDGVWIERTASERVESEVSDAVGRAGRGEHLPLAGRRLAVKGNIDVAGFDTTAACPAFARRPDRSAAAVRALVGAGAVVVGVTNLDQFATGLVGTRSPYGICPNALWPGRVSGGSSSGSAVAVASGQADLALGTDTAGSGRVPAAANGIVGIKPTRGRISSAGVVPACASLDCVSVFARSVDEGRIAVELAVGFDSEDPWSRDGHMVPVPDRRLRFGVADPDALVVDGEEANRQRFRIAAGMVVEASAGSMMTVDVGSLLDAGRLLYDGAFVAERYAAVGAFVEAHPEEVDPVVRRIITNAGRLPAWRLADDMTALARYRRSADEILAGVDVLIVPTVPRIPTVAEVLVDPVGVNSMLGTYTNFVNLLDMCALTLPVPTPLDDPSVPTTSVTLVAPAWHDDVLVAAARVVELTPGGRASLPPP